MDWGRWSKDCASIMQSRTDELLRRHGIAANAAYRWDLETGAMQIGDVTIRIVTVGTVSGGSFLWSWANEAIPAAAKAGIDRVRSFGLEHGLSLLSEPCASGGLSQAKECVAIAGRILDASGIWIDRTDSGFVVTNCCSLSRTHRGTWPVCALVEAIGGRETSASRRSQIGCRSSSRTRRPTAEMVRHQSSELGIGVGSCR
jgi:hypothetical protein